MPKKISELEKLDQYLNDELARRAARPAKRNSANFFLTSIKDMFISVTILALFVAAYFFFTSPKQTDNDVLGTYKIETSFLVSTGQLYSYPEDVQKMGEKVTVTEVYDGDTIKVRRADNSIVTVRYLGINAPEVKHGDIGTNENYGAQAALENALLLASKEVYLIKDVSDTDEEGRLLRYVYQPGGIQVNYALVRIGYATVFSVPPDISMQSKMVEAQQAARSEKRNLWKE